MTKSIRFTSGQSTLTMDVRFTGDGYDTSLDGWEVSFRDKGACMWAGSVEELAALTQSKESINEK